MTAERTMLSSVLILAVLAMAALTVIGPARIWTLFGPADLGPVVFETLVRRSSPNDALACPPGLCPVRSDITPPVFAATTSALQLALGAVIAVEPRITQVATDEAPHAVRYVQRSALMGFPDTIVVRFIELAGGRSTLALYSRSQLGYSDLGANRARLDRWLERLKAKLPVAQ